MGSTFANKLTNWYSKSKRALPWRGQSDPYVVWVSEIMLQQTRIEAVRPYFARWMERFPTIKDLAAASQQEVLHLWEGLGYYSRARNLHKAAQIVAAEQSGQLPENAKALRKLPGIGRYTAGAIASLAFGLDEPVVDGNVKRVLSRVFDVQQSVDTSAGEKIIWGLAEKHLPPGQADDYNQAIMDLGATICLPRNPKCGKCPVKAMCRAYALSIQEQRPVFKPKNNIPHHTVAAAVIRENGRILIAQRPQKALLGGMWGFPGGRREKGESLRACLRREMLEEFGVQINVGDELRVFKHAYTHFRVTLHAFTCTVLEGKPRLIVSDELKWVKPDSLEDYPMGKLDRQISRTLRNKN